jgi:hypothetical protein
MSTKKTKKTKASKFETCRAKVTKFKFAKGVSLRSVMHNGKKMLFWSDISEQLSALKLGGHLKDLKVKVNVTKEQPGVRYLIDLDSFNNAYTKYATQAAKELFAPLKKTPTPIEQFNFSFIDMAEPEKVCAEPEVPTKTEEPQCETQLQKLDLTKVKPFSTEVISASEANSDRFSIVDASPGKPAPQKIKADNDLIQEAMRQGIIASVSNYIAKRCPDMRADSSEYKNVHQKTWVALIERFKELIGPYIQEKYRKTLNDFSLAFDLTRMLKPENYLLRLMDFDKSQGDQLLKMLQDTSDACFDICRSSK